MDWKKSKQTAQRLLDKYGSKVPPINVFDIASDEGLEIVYFKPDGEFHDVSGLLDKEDRKIYLNVEEPAERQTYTIAHELGHYLLDHKPDEYGVYKRHSFTDVDKPGAEKEADKFAAELLMPESMVTSTMKQYDLTRLDAQILAKLFGVSRSAMTFRLKSLGL